MNKKTKIIISIVGITIVLLALIGLTYAYFLTRINGNTNTKSISVSTANLALVYGDDDGSIIGEGEKIIPGATFDAKTFTVTNQGNAKTDYVVVIENVSVTYAETIEVDGVTQTAGATTTFQSNDFVYTLTCTSGCNGVNEETTFPINGGILVGNSIDVGETQTYAFTLTYKETGLDQTDDMNKSLNAKLNIKDISTINPYSSSTNSLAYNIINNAITGANGTTLMSTPLTTPAEATAGWAYETDKGTEATSESSISISTTYQGYYWTYGTGYTINESTGKFTLTGVSTCKYNDGTCHETLVGKYIVSTSASSNSSSSNTQKTTTNLSNIYKVTTAPASSTSSIAMKAKSISPIPYSTEKVLSVTSDDYGTSYYYRGGVEDNYVNFAGMCWRIVRIEGDGSTKLLLEDRNAECNSSTFTGNWSDGSTYVFGYDSSNRANFLNYSGGLADSFKTFQTSKLSGSLDKLKVDEWCYDDTITETGSYGYDEDYNTVYTESEATNGWYTYEYYGAYTRIITNKKPSLVCTGKKLTNYADSTNMYVGTLTADEMSFAGAAYNTSNYAYYLINDYTKNNYLVWWSLSPNDFYEENGYDRSFYLGLDGGLYYYDLRDNYSSRPAVTLKSSAEITSGNGTKNSPYVIG